MNSKKLAIFLLCLILTAAIIMTGCNKDEPDVQATAAKQTAKTDDTKEAAEVTEAPQEIQKISAMIWHGGEGSSDSMSNQRTIERFIEKNIDKYEVDMEYIEADQTKVKLATLMASNSAPDVFMAWASGYLKPYVDADKVYCLDDEFANDPEWKSKYSDGILSPVSYGGKVYAIPTLQTSIVMYYNKTMIDEYNLQIDTYEHVKEAVAVLNENGITPIALANKEAWEAALVSELIVDRIGGHDPYNKVVSGEGKWDDPAFARAAEIMKELTDIKAFPEGFNGMQQSEAEEMFKRGDAAMFVMGTWLLQPLTADDSPIKDDVDIAIFPAFGEGAGDPNTWLGTPNRNLAISESCEYKEAAVNFIKEFGTDETQQDLVDSGLIPAASNSVDFSNAPRLLLRFHELQKGMSDMITFYDVDLGPVIGNEYNNVIQAIMAGKSVDEAFQDFQTFVEQNSDE